MKKTIIFLCVLLCGLLFNGCATISFKVETDETGQITQSVTVMPDYEVLSQKGITRDTVNERILTLYNTIIEKQKQRFLECDKLNAEEKDKLLSRIEFCQPRFDGELSITFKQIFANNKDLSSFYCSTSKSNMREISNNFFWLVSNETKTIFYDIDKSDLAQLIKSITPFDKLNFTVDDINFFYTYGTCDRLQRSNADYVTTQNDMYYHT